MDLGEKVSSMLKDAEEVYAALDTHFGDKTSPARSAAGHVRVNLRRLNNFIQGRPPIPIQGVEGETPLRGLEGVTV